MSVDIWTLVLMIAAAVAGSWFGAGVVSGWPRRNIQIGMGLALLVAATLFLLRIFEIAPGGGDALALDGRRSSRSASPSTSCSAPSWKWASGSTARA